MRRERECTNNDYLVQSRSNAKVVDQRTTRLLEDCEIPTNLPHYGTEQLPDIQQYLSTLGIRILYFNEVSCARALQ